MNRPKINVIVAVALVGLAASIFTLRAIHPRIVATYWRQQLAVAPEDRVEIVIHQIAQLDMAGAAILVEALDSDRECVVQAAKRELFARLEHWRMLSSDQYASRLRVLTETLAREVDHFGPAAKRDAMDVAARILHRPFKGGTIAVNKLLAASEKIVRTGFNVQVEPIRVKSGDCPDFRGHRREAVVGENGTVPFGLHVDLTRLKNEDSIADSLLPVPESPESSKEPIADSSVSSNNRSSGESIASPEKLAADESQAFDSQANRPRFLERREASRIPDHAETAGETGRGAAQNKQSAASDQVRSLSSVDPRATERQLSSSLAAVDIVALMRELNAADDSRAAAVEAELIHRGFSSTQLELARRLFDPDPAVRMKLVQQLPGTQGVDVVPWLLRLCRDTDAEVRLAAITFLATSSDPAVLDEAEQIAMRDTDSSVRRIAVRIAQQRNPRQR